MVRQSKVVPFFSIITCTKNSSNYIRTCLESIKSQTFRDFEQIIIDGKSTDQTIGILSKYKLKPFSQSPSGIASAMNAGVKHARGQYLFFLNSDDSFYDADVLKKVHSFLLAHPDLDWVFGNIHETDGVKTIGFPPKRKIFQGMHPNLLKYYNYIPHQATFIKKSVFTQHGLFDESLKSMMDPEYWLRICDATQWGYMPIVVANYLIRPDSQSENISHAEANTREYEIVQSKYLTFLELSLAKLINKILR